MNRLLTRVTAPPEPEKEPQRKYLFLIVAAVLLVGCLAYVMFKPTAAAPEAQQPSGPDVAVALPSPLSTGTCNFKVPAGTDITDVVPADTVWALSGAMAAPSSKSAGPASSEAGISACYAHTPAGALFALSNFVVDLSDTTLDANALVSQRVSKATGYEALAQRVQVWTAQDHPATEQSLRQIAAFRLVSYNEGTAVIELVQRNTSGTGAGLMASTVNVMVWEDDDWKLSAPVDGGDPPSPVGMTQILPPYTAFNGA